MHGCRQTIEGIQEESESVDEDDDYWQDDYQDDYYREDEREWEDYYWGNGSDWD